MNPFLPLDVYIPDGEPHVFGDRVYLFGSHDDENGTTYCALDYEFYSAPVDDYGRIRLYYGMCYPFEDMPLAKLAAPLHRRVQAGMFHKSVADIARYDGVQGAITVELDDDMLTVTSTPRRIIPSRTRGTGFAGHAFWEGSSIRKIDDTYYFVYSSFNSHELCYATSRHPDRDFVFRGTIVSGGDIGYRGRKPKDRLNYTATNHGGIEQIDGRWYVFYHRNTHGLIHRRQACAEPIEILPDGTIPQVPVTSAGLNGGALPASGSYPAVLCATLGDGRMPHVRARRRMPIITHDDHDRYLGGVTSGTRISWRDFAFTGATTVTFRSRGTGNGTLRIGAGDARAELPITASARWRSDSVRLEVEGEHPLTVEYDGAGTVELLDLSFS